MSFREYRENKLRNLVADNRTAKFLLWNGNRRQDEIGTPYCITYDFDSVEDGAVTVRDRDTMEQERIKIEDLKDYFAEKFNY